MSESAFVFNRPRAGPASSENIHSPGESGKRKQHRQQPRQLLSCTKCRERKVKCDRTKPCTACCARGSPKECHFVAEGGDYAPIQQSYELRKLRAENLRLKERLRASKISFDDDEAEAGSPESQYGEGAAGRLQKRRFTKQHRFQGPEWTDNLYFGSPGLANVINEFASLNVSPSSPYPIANLTHAMPRGVDMYAPRDLPLYPFATLFSWSLEECIPQLLQCLPPRDELFGYLDAFQKRVHVCFFPHIPTEITKSEVERFLSDAPKNTEKCPDMLALLFAALALGSQHSVWDKSGGKWVPGAMEEESKRGNLFITAAKQALRMASFMNRPTLLGIQALIMMGPYLTNSGRFLDAWTLFGTTIRLAQSIGLHRQPKYLDPAPPTQRECHMRQTLWWWMLHMDQHYSMTLGRPLGISGIGDCPPPYELTTDQTFLRFGEFVHQFTVVARHILSSGRLSTAKIDEFTDSLLKLLDTMPEMLQFDESWLNEDTEIPEWPLGAMAAVFYCKTHNYLILLNRRRVDKKAPQTPANDIQTTPGKASSPSFQAVNYPGSSQSSPRGPRKTLRGRALVLSSSEDLLIAFLFFYIRVPAVLVCWAMGQQAFNSCMILILDALETGDLKRIWKVEKAYAVFTELDNNGVHKLANLAVEKISWGLNELKRMQDDAQSGDRGNAGSRSLGRCHAVDMESLTRSGSEATPYPATMQDTVMGNTGMLLLEDPGLQSYVQEQFSPFTWVMTASETKSLGSTSPTPKQKETEESSFSPPPKSDPSTTRRGSSSFHFARSSEKAHGTQGSGPGSAAARYTTLSPAAGQGQRQHSQKQGLTSAASSRNSTAARQQKETRVRRISAASDQGPPPHLRHHSYPPPQHAFLTTSSNPPHTASCHANANPSLNLQHQAFPSRSEFPAQPPSMHTRWRPQPMGPPMMSSGPGPTPNLPQHAASHLVTAVAHRGSTSIHHPHSGYRYY